MHDVHTCALVTTCHCRQEAKNYIMYGPLQYLEASILTFRGVQNNRQGQVKILRMCPGELFSVFEVATRYVLLCQANCRIQVDLLLIKMTDLSIETQRALTFLVCVLFVLL
jgi:hypothetical protein